MTQTFETFMTLDEARDYLSDAVMTQGRDFIYARSSESCYYIPLKTADATDPRRLTGCLIGTALKLAGREDMLLDVIADVNTRANYFGLTQEAAAYLQKAQTMQDSGFSWGSAFDEAERSIA